MKRKPTNRSFPRLLSAVALAALVALSATGCRTQRALYAHFDSDTVGASPIRDLPGPPAGDELWSLPAEMPASVLGVVDSPVLRSQSLRFSSEGPEFSQIAFFPRPIAASAPMYHAYWMGTMGAGSTSIDIVLVAGDFETIGGLRLQNGDVELLTRSGTEKLGTYLPDVRHVVVFSVDRRTDTVNVSFLQSGRTLFRHDMPVVEPGAHEEPRLALLFCFCGSGPRIEYVMDAVVISERAPEM